MGLAIASYMTSEETNQRELVKVDKSSKPIYLVKFDKKIVGYTTKELMSEEMIEFMKEKKKEILLSIMFDSHYNYYWRDNYLLTNDVWISTLYKRAKNSLISYDSVTHTISVERVYSIDIPSIVKSELSEDNSELSSSEQTN